METSFVPLSHHRLPPDGDEFPSRGWPEERNFVPPLPTTQPPDDDPPPLPTSGPPRTNLTTNQPIRRTSFQETKKYSNQSDPTEPSVRSVKDKIALFSPEDSSSDSSLLPMRSTKSSENLFHILPSSTKPPPNSRRKESLNDRAKSLADVSHFISNCNNVQGESQDCVDSGKKLNSPESLLEERRKCLSRLRGLVIPDKDPPLIPPILELPPIRAKDPPPIISSTTPKFRPLGRVSSSEDKSPNSKDILIPESTWRSSLPKYSPAFKRRVLTPYVSKSPTTSTPEPKSLESLTSPKSDDSSFEYMSPIGQEVKILSITTMSSITRPLENEEKTGKKGDESDNDSAVSSSPSSIAHELSPRDSPTPPKRPTTSVFGGVNLKDEDSANNSDEGWRILKAESTEAMSRKSIITSAKLRNGGEDEEGTYADAEDTESSLSDAEPKGIRKGKETEEEETEGEEFGELDQSPLDAILDMEVKMAYINEICDALPMRNAVPNRYFNNTRRDSEATVIERPILERRDSQEPMERRRDRSSSGNESDFSSSLSVGSTAEKSSSEKREKMPKVCTMPTGGILEKKIERIIEKTTTDGVVHKTKTTNIPRGRNDFKSLSEKWQQISNQTKPIAKTPPPAPNFSIPIRRGENGVWGEKRPTNEIPPSKRSVSVNDIRRAFEKAEEAVSSGREEKEIQVQSPSSSGLLSPPSAHFRVSSFDSTTSEEGNNPYSLLSSTTRDPYGSITSLASSTSLISPQELQQLIDEANQSLEEAGTPSHEVSVVLLHREFAGGSLGITLAGGADYETKEITVHKVLSGSIADRDGRVHRGDRVLSINGKNTKGLTHRDALNLLKAPRTEVVLVVSRGRTSGNSSFSTIDETSVTLDRAVEPLLNGTLASFLENDDDTAYSWGQTRTLILVKDGAGLGFSLDGGKGSINGDKPLTVKKIFVGGPAEKSGGLRVGDLITTINDTKMGSKSRTEAWNFMKKLSDGEVRLSVRSPLNY